MPTPVESGVPDAGKWPAVDVSQGKPAHRSAGEPALRLRARGTADGNVALCLLVHDICRQLGLATLTVPYCNVRLDPVSTNPVLEPSLIKTPESVALTWRTGGRHLSCYLGDAFRAIAKPLDIARGSCGMLPAGIAYQPSGEPVLMLHYERMSTHAITRRGARTATGAWRGTAGIV